MKLGVTRLIAATAIALLCSAAGADIHFKVSYDKAAFAGPFTGRVVIYLSKSMPEPRLGPNWEAPEPIYSIWADALPAGQAVVLDSHNATSFPSAPSTLAAGTYTIQAVVDRNLGGRALGSSPGNLFSKPAKIDLDPGKDSSVDIVCDQVVPEPVFKETGHVKLAEMQSALLTKFYGRPTFMRAAVILPADWDANPGRKYPEDINVPGFGGAYMNLSGQDFSLPPFKGISFIGIYLDPNCPTGHTVFADSDNNGPWGEALTEEFLPFIEKKFRAIGQPGARFVEGHSSGGWSSLWLQVAYPDYFGGVYSTSPDPVDFNAFQNTDLYEPRANMYFDKQGVKYKLARLGGDKFLYMKDYAAMERPIRGEQLGSFNAVFSPRGADGQPASMWDQDTGAVNSSVVNHWKSYDIDLVLKKHWKTLAPKLKGKIHVWCGTGDTFYLDRAVRLMAAEMKSLGSDAEIGMVPGDHFTMMTKDLGEHIEGEMSDAYRAWKTQHPGAKGN